MEETMGAIDAARNAAASSYLHTGQDLNKLLACVSMELESTRVSAKAQSQMYEARVRHLEELVKSTRKERDEYKEKFLQLQSRVLSKSRSIGSGMSQEPQGRSLSGLESVASMSEQSRVALTEVHHRKLHGQQQQQVDLQKQLEYVSSMNEPTRETLTEVHRKIQEQQQQLELHQHLHHQLQHQRSTHSHELRTASTNSHLDFQSQQHQQLEELRQHLEIQHKDRLPEQQLHMDMGMGMGDRHPGEVGHSEVDNGSDAKSTTWNDFPTGVHMEMHSSNEPCLILDSPDHMQMKLPPGMPPSPRVDQHSPPPHLDDLQQLQQQQQQDENMQLHLHQQLQQQHHQQDADMQLHSHEQQESDQQQQQLLTHMQQQGQGADSRVSLHIQDEQQQQQQQPFRRQLSKRQDGLSAISAGLQGTNEMSMSVMQQHSSWPVGLMGLSNGCPPGLPDQLLQSSCLQGGSVVASILSPLERLGDSRSSSLHLARPVHLPEPPEADPQVMLNSLPEKGKLLQAVMQAGPLLQTLLLAGPLPQWRHPPPPLDAEEIPRVSMGTSGGIMPPVDQAIGLMASHGSSLEQVMRLSTPVQSSPSQNGFCH